MLKKIFFLFLCLITNSLFAASAFLYQIDLIVFTHSKPRTIDSTPVIAPPDFSNALTLLKSNNEEEMPYKLLPVHSSNLINEYNKLNKESNYQILLNYSWLQPSENDKSIIIPNLANDDWILNGTLRIKQSTYYAFDTDLILTSNKNMQFPVQYKKRLKPEIVYYLDHPYAGILIKIHQII